MNSIYSKSRRAFFLQGGAALGAGVATVAAATSPGKSQPPGSDVGTSEQLAIAQDREAIRQLHLAFVSRVESHSLEATAGLVISRLRPNHLQQNDTLLFSDDRLQATATYHVDAALGTPLPGDSTIAQMARLQGQLANHRWETGRLEAKYVKTNGHWQMSSLSYLASAWS